MNTHAFEQFASSNNLPMPQAKLPPPTGNFMGKTQPPPTGPGLPVAYVPGPYTTITQCSTALMKVIAPTQTLFLRGTTDLVIIEKDSDGRPSLHAMPQAGFRSFAEGHVAFACKHWDNKTEAFVDKPCILSNDAAGAIMACRLGRLELPQISCIVNCPRLQKDGSITSSGYDSAGKIFVAGDVTIKEPAKVEEAVQALLNLFRDCNFAQDSDRSRVIAALLALMLRIGPWHGERIAFPIILIEADQSQTGKGFCAKIIAAVYGEIPGVVAVSRGGVGSFDEAFSKTTLRGHPFVLLDNLRGRIDSQLLEAFSTSVGPTHVRALRRDGEVDSRNFVIFATSNGMESTVDMANRLLVVRLKKQSTGYQWHQWPEGSILKHIEANRGFYLGCICRILRTWMAAGSPEIPCRHDMREFAGAMNWIVQHLFKLPPLVQDHVEIQTRVAKPGTTFLREIALRTKKAASKLTVTDMVDLAVEESIAIPGVDEFPSTDEELKKAKLAVGRLIKPVFADSNSINIDNFTIERRTTNEPRPDGNGTFQKHAYTFTNSSVPPTRGQWSETLRNAQTARHSRQQSSAVIHTHQQLEQSGMNYGATTPANPQSTTISQTTSTHAATPTVATVVSCSTTVMSSGDQSLPTTNL